jgi:hypothetical protein
MLLLKKPTNNHTVWEIPMGVRILIGGFFIYNGSIEDFTPQQISDYKIIEVTQEPLRTDIQLLDHDVWDGQVRKMTTGPNPLSDPLEGDLLASHLRAIKYIAKLGASDFYDSKYQASTVIESVLEQSTWAQQLSEANIGGDMPLLTLLAQAKNITVEQYADQVKAAATAHTDARNALVAELKTAYQTIDRAETAEAVKALGWI